jgi:hypothetical protein
VCGFRVLERWRADQCSVKGHLPMERQQSSPAA